MLHTVRQDVLDYSALQAALSWVVDALGDDPNVLPSVQSDAHALSNAIALTAGRGITKIWATFAHDARSSLDVQDERRLEFSAFGLDSSA